MRPIRLFDQNAYQKSFTAAIVDQKQVADCFHVILDKTAFYPESGGQPSDRGALNNAPVHDVIEQDDTIVHVLKSPMEKGSTVTGRIDWARRFDHMQQHTGQHILSQSFVQIAKAETIGFHLGTQICTIDLDRSGLSEAVIQQVENAANRIVMENRMVHVHRVQPEEVPRFNLRKAPVTKEVVRIVEIKGFDANGCCGTHVKSTGEVGPIKILRQEKYKGGSRITFVCGFRALGDYQKKQRLTNEVAVILNSSEDEIIENLKRRQSERKRDQKRFKFLNQRLLESESKDLMKEAQELESCKLILKSYSDRTPSELQQLARLLVQNEQTVVLLGCKDDKAHIVLACHSNMKFDMNGVLQEVIPLIEGRGGGTKQIAQGNGPLVANLDGLLSKARERMVHALP